MREHTRKCHKCDSIAEIGYHYYKDGSKHIVMICPTHGYQCFPFEELNLRRYETIKSENYPTLFKKKELLIAGSPINKSKGLSASELLSF